MSNRSISLENVTLARSIAKSQKNCTATVDGDFLGRLNRTTTIEKVNNKDGKIQYISTEINDYELAEEYATIPAYTEKFADSTKINTFSINEENELEVNGEVISENDFPTFSLRASDAGGTPSISHYYSNSDRTRYTFGTYSDVYFKFDHGVYVSPTGNHAARSSITRSNTYFQEAKVAMDSVETNYRDVHVQASLFAFEEPVE